MNATQIPYAHLESIVEAQPYPLLFATISGAHLYGFASADSDFDLCGTHILPLRAVLGLSPQEETREVSSKDADLELDLVTHDVTKFARLLVKKNGYVLEQLLSPLVVQTTPEHEELKRLAPRCITRHHAWHYLGFAETQWKLFTKENPPRVKPLLYIYRVLLTGIHLMRTGEINANLVQLNDLFRLPCIPELIARKTSGTEKQQLTDADLDFRGREYARLRGELEKARDASTLPEMPTAQPALDDLLVRIRMRYGQPT